MVDGEREERFDATSLVSSSDSFEIVLNSKVLTNRRLMLK